MNTEEWLILVLSIPGPRGSDRVRIWRALKGLGAAVLRDGVYLAPALEPIYGALAAQRDAVREVGGSAYLFRHRAAGNDDEYAAFSTLFDRGAEYAGLMERVSRLGETLNSATEAEARRTEAQLRRDYENIRVTDFFPNTSQDEAGSAIAALAKAVNARFSPDEPQAMPDSLPRLRASDYRGRVWATRERMWVDRAASAWLIRRFIDPEARFNWLKHPSECPKDAVGFDFDGAEFSHSGSRVTFEVLLYCFGLDADPGLTRIGAMVNFLDVGGLPVAEASGFVALMAGARRRARSDDDLLRDVGLMLDFLYDAYSEVEQGQNTG